MDAGAIARQPVKPLAHLLLGGDGRGRDADRERRPTRRRPAREVEPALLGLLEGLRVCGDRSRRQDDLAELAAGGEAVVGLLGLVERERRRHRHVEAPRSNSGSTSRSTSRIAIAFSSSGRARSVEPWIRAALAHQGEQVELGLEPARPRRSPRSGRRWRAPSGCPARLGAPTSSRTTSNGPVVLEALRIDRAWLPAARPAGAAPRCAPSPSRARRRRGRAGPRRCPPRRPRRARAGARPAGARPG